MILLHEGLWALGLEGSAQLLGGMGDLSDHRELELPVVHLHDVLSAALLIRDGGGMDDLDRARVCAVAASHLLVKLPNRAVDIHVAKLLVHVVRVGATVIAQPDAIVLHLGRGRVVQLIHGQQLATALLGLIETLHEIPEAGLGQHDIPGKDPHAVDLGRRVLRGWRRSAYDLVLMHGGLQGLVNGEPLAHGYSGTLKGGEVAIVGGRFQHLKPHATSGAAPSLKSLRKLQK